jgi:8-oxo-dGTP pyrophosphatase MutT (NUDIX family)
VSAVAHDVVGALVCRSGRVLLCHRTPSQEWFPGVWDLPGGHVQPSERAEDALARELDEELGIRIAISPQQLPVVSFLGDEFLLRIWVVTTWQGEPSNHAPDEHDEIAWISIQMARTLPMADERYRPLIEAVLGEPATGECCK